MIRQSDCDDRFRRVHLKGDKGAVLPPRSTRPQAPFRPSFGVWREVPHRG